MNNIANPFNVEDFDFTLEPPPKSMAHSHLKIALIDSGVGGFSILNSFLYSPLFPYTQFYYIADSGHLPYGLKSDDYIHQRMMILTQYLLNKEIDALVIACNTATAVSVDPLRIAFPQLPIIGVEPAIKPAAEATKTHHIAVAATLSTLNSQRLSNLIARYAQHCTIHPIIGSEWVTLVESGDFRNPEISHPILQRSLNVTWNYPIDQLILGCTHFPFLAEMIMDQIPMRVELINPAKSIVQQCYQRLRDVGKNPLTYSTIAPQSVGSLQLMTTGSLPHFTEQAYTLIPPRYHKHFSFQQIES